MRSTVWTGGQHVVQLLESVGDRHLDAVLSSPCSLRSNWILSRTCFTSGRGAIFSLYSFALAQLTMLKTSSAMTKAQRVGTIFWIGSKGHWEGVAS